VSFHLECGEVSVGILLKSMRLVDEKDRMMGRREAHI
jgi:hypothetical protein